MWQWIREAARVILEAGDDAHRGIRRYLDGVLPGVDLPGIEREDATVAQRLAIQHLELHQVDMHRVHHVAGVLELPDLGRAELRHIGHVIPLLADHIAGSSSERTSHSKPQGTFGPLIRSRLKRRVFVASASGMGVTGPQCGRDGAGESGRALHHELHHVRHAWRGRVVVAQHDLGAGREAAEIDNDIQALGRRHGTDGVELIGALIRPRSVPIRVNGMTWDGLARFSSRSE